MLDGEVVLHGVGHPDVTIDGSRKARSLAGAARTGGWVYTGEDDGRTLCGPVVVAWFTEDKRLTPEINGDGRHVIEDAKAAAENGIVAPGSISDADPWCKVVSVTPHDGLARQTQLAGFDNVRETRRKQRADL